LADAPSTPSAVAGTRRALLAGAGLGAIALAIADDAAAQGGDTEILNFALTLEYLTAAFYTEAAQGGALSGETAEFARVVAGHERAHVDALRNALGGKATAAPRFDFGGATDSMARFLRTAVKLEDLSVFAYKGQAPLVRSDAVLAAALGIHAVEARHAAWIREIAGLPPAPRAYDRALDRTAVVDMVVATGFLAPTPTTTSGQPPLFTG
jgi:rubrerythrin